MHKELNPLVDQIFFRMVMMEDIDGVSDLKNPDTALEGMHDLVIRMYYSLMAKFSCIPDSHSTSDHTWWCQIGLFSVALDREDDHGYADLSISKWTLRDVGQLISAYMNKYQLNLRGKIAQ